jgi:feruloyl esterase
MARRVLACSILALVFSLTEIFGPPVIRAAGGTSCASLAALSIPSITIKSATQVPAGPFTPNGSNTALTLPAFCRVEGTARPTTDSDIKFEVWIPPSDAWNGKLEGVGNGGYSGAIPYAALAAGLRRGYATAASDTGHSGDDMKFGQGHPEKVVDWAHRAVHATSEAAKLILRNHTGKFPDHSYFDGCSTGGQQALSEAQRYPDDYDGIIAGDPGNNRVRQTFGFLWSWSVSHRDGVAVIPAAKLSMITKAVVDACDGLDGLKDGIIDDPRRCHYDPGRLLCKGADEPSCLTAAQVEAVRKIYDGPKNPRTGEQIYSGWARGSEGFGETPAESWRTYIMDPPEPMRVGFFRYFLFHDPGWDWHTLDWDRDLTYAEQKLAFLSAVDRDLTAFKRRGGRLLMYTGWSDPIVPPLDAVTYYDGVVKTMGGLEKTREFYRFFLAPGMGHCGGGPGPNTFDTLAALEQWVEKGSAPDKLLASHSTNGKVDRTRPLCPYPQVARWKGTGSTDEAANFMCVTEAAPAPVRKTSQN